MVKGTAAIIGGSCDGLEFFQRGGGGGGGWGSSKILIDFMTSLHAIENPVEFRT